jgi:thiamine pyrophosphokinase
VPQQETKALGVLAGEDMPLEQLLLWANSADLILAADSGADRLLAAGSSASILVGDMDSVSEQGLLSASEVHHLEGQDTTDCDKLLAVAAGKGLRSITLISVEGSQPDHEFSTLLSAAGAGLDVRLAFRRGIGSFLRPLLPFSQHVHEGTRLSVLPLQDCRGVFLAGVRWPLSGASLSPLGLRSISNEALGGQVECSLESGCALVYVESGPEPNW